MTTAIDNISQVRQLCQHVLGHIDWRGSEGYCLCPGEQQHPACLVRIGSNGVPFAFCLHEKCKDDVAGANSELRNLCLFNGVIAERKLTPQDRALWAELKRLRQVEWMARTGLLPKLIRQPVELEDWIKASPFPVFDLAGVQQSRAFICGLYPRTIPCRVTEKGLYLEVNHLVWVGDPWETDSDRQPLVSHADRFRSVQSWMAAPDEDIRGQQVSHCTFKTGPHRRKEAIRERILLTLESDVLTPEQFGGIVRYMQKYSTLRSITRTGNKGIHCNFDYTYNVDLFAILKGLGCDDKMWKSSLTTRLPGQERKDDQGWPTGRMQELLYLNPVFEVTL